MNQYDPDDFLGSPRTGELLFEFTSRCNIRCAYCACSQPDYQGTEFPLEHFDNLTRLVLDRRPEKVLVNGHGETTAVKDWDRYCRSWLDKGLELEIITNLAKPLSPTEVATLARFHKLVFSIDTVDATLFGQLRRGAKFSTFSSNLDNILTAVRSQPQPPSLSFSIVVMDVNAFSLADLVDYGLAHDVSDFNFCNYVQYPPADGAMEVQHVGALPFEKRQELLPRLEGVLKKIEECGSSYSFPDGIMEAVKAPPVSPSPVEAEGRKVFPSQPTVPTGMTRQCLDPWSFCYIQADAALRLCCFSNETIGHPGTGQDLHELLDGDLPRAYRKGLLSGQLREPCLKCWARPWISIQEFREQVADYLAGGPNDRVD